ncbi:hypothetical protein KI387_000346, partial [Taxus chinensis]
VFFKGGKSYELACAVGLLNRQKLHDISNGMALLTTLYHMMGNAVGNGVFLNIIDLKGGKVGLGAVMPGSKAKLDAMYAGCKIFVRLITITGVLKTHEDAITTGLTLFVALDPLLPRCPRFAASTMPWVRCLHDYTKIFVDTFPSLN